VEWAGHSVDVLLRIYAKCLDGTHDAARHWIEEALGDAVPNCGHESEDEAQADGQGGWLTPAGHVERARAVAAGLVAGASVLEIYNGTANRIAHDGSSNLVVMVGY
jgi:hypothetical protein